MDEILIKFFNKIADGNIAITIFSSIAGIAVISYLVYQISHVWIQHNKATNDDSDNAELIINLIQELQSTLNDFIRDINIDLLKNNSQLEEKIEQIEKELIRGIDSLGHKLELFITTSLTNLNHNVTNNISKTSDKLENSVNKDLVEIRLQRKEIKETLENNIKDVKSKLDTLQELLRSNDSSFSKITNVLESIKHALDVTNLVNSSIRLSPLKKNDHDHG